MAQNKTEERTEQLEREVRDGLNGKVDDRKIIRKNPSVSDLLEGQSLDFLIPNKGPTRVLRHQNKLHYIRYQKTPDYDNVVGE